MRAQPDEKGPWYHAFFPSREVARYHRDCQRGRGRIARYRRNGAGWEVFWREKVAPNRRRVSNA